MTIFACADAHGLIVYHGIGLDDNEQTPSDWLLDLDERVRAFDLPLANLVEAIRADTEIRLQQLGEKYGRDKSRHSFILAVWHQGLSTLFCISNYQTFDAANDSDGDAVLLTSKPPSPGSTYRLVHAGGFLKHVRRQPIKDAMKSGSANAVKVACVRAVRDVAYGSGKGRGAVGASAQWAVIG
jgi:hypothetical protein